MSERKTRSDSGITKPSKKLQQTNMETKKNARKAKKTTAEKLRDSGSFLDTVLKEHKTKPTEVPHAQKRAKIGAPKVHVISPNKKLFPDVSLTETAVAPKSPVGEFISTGNIGAAMLSPSSPAPPTPRVSPNQALPVAARSSISPNSLSVPSTIEFLAKVFPQDVLAALTKRTKKGPTTYEGSSLKLDDLPLDDDSTSFADSMFVESIVPNLSKALRRTFHQTKELGSSEIDHLTVWVCGDDCPPPQGSKRKAVHTRARRIFRSILYIRTRAFVNGYMKHAGVLHGSNPAKFASFRLNKQQSICLILKEIKQPHPTVSDLEWYAGDPWAKAESRFAESIKRGEVVLSSEGEGLLTDDEYEEIDQIGKRKASDIDMTTLPAAKRIYKPSPLQQSLANTQEEAEEEEAEEEDEEEENKEEENKEEGAQEEEEEEEEEEDKEGPKERKGKGKGEEGKGEGKEAGEDKEKGSQGASR